MLFCLSSLRHEYKLLYLRTSLLSNDNILSSFSKLHFESNFFLHKFNIERLFNRQSLKLKKSKNLSFLFKNLNISVPSNCFSFMRKHRSSFIRVLVKNLKYVRFRSWSKPSSLIRYNFSLFLPLRFLSLNSLGLPMNQNYNHNQVQNALSQIYSRFFFLYPSCTHDEVQLTSFLRFLFSNYSASNFLSSNSFLLNRLIMNSFFFSRKKRSVRFGAYKSKKRSRSFRFILKHKKSLYKRSKMLICAILNFISKKRCRGIKKRKVGARRFSKILRSRMYYYRRYRKSMIWRKPKRKFLKFARLSSHFFGLRSFSYDSSSLSTFVNSLNRLIYRCFVVKKSKPFPLFSFSRPPVPSKLVPSISNSSLFSFYKKHQLSKLNRFVKHVRLLKSKTYNLHLKETGSNIYSTFMHDNKMLFSMWSGRFGLKKRLKYRKKAGHSISHHFHRFISNMYKKKKIRKLNFVVKGFPKFFEICLSALARQIAYSQNYYIRFHKHKRFILRFAKRYSRGVYKSFRKKLFSSSLKSFMLPLVSSSFNVNLNASDINLLIPEFSSNDIFLLNNIIKNDNSYRSDLLLRVLRARRYKRHFKTVNPSFDSNRSLLVNKLIGIFMIRYGISSKKDFYKAVSYLNKYKSSIFNYPHSDKSDFMSAYAILYVLQILKQNRLYYSKLMACYSMLRRKFARYSRTLHSLVLKRYPKDKNKSKRKNRAINKNKRSSFRYGSKVNKTNNRASNSNNNPRAFYNTRPPHNSRPGYHSKANFTRKSSPRSKVISRPAVEVSYTLKSNVVTKSKIAAKNNYRFSNNNRRGKVKVDTRKNKRDKHLFSKKRLFALKKRKKSKMLFSRLSSYVKTNVGRSHIQSFPTKGSPVMSIFNLFCSSLLRSLKVKFKSKFKRGRVYKVKVRNKNKIRLRNAFFFMSKYPSHPFSNYLRTILMRSFVSFVRRFSGKYDYTLSSRLRDKLFNYFFLKKFKRLLRSKLNYKSESKKSKLLSLFKKVKPRGKRALKRESKRQFQRKISRSLKKSLIRSSLLRLLNKNLYFYLSPLRGVSSSGRYSEGIRLLFKSHRKLFDPKRKRKSAIRKFLAARRRFLNFDRRRSKLGFMLKRSHFFRNMTRHSLLLRRLRSRRYRALLRRQKRRRFSVSPRSRMNRPHKYLWFIHRTRRNRQFSKFPNGERRRVLRRSKFSLSLRSIRNRMRNFIRLITTFGYVKCRSSLSHGGCSSRKRSYDKRYIF